MKKRFLAIILAAAMAVCLLPGAALAVVGDTFDSGGFTYEVLTDPVGTTPGTVEVEQAGYTSDTYTIPSSVSYGTNTYTVTQIGEETFLYHTGLKNITIPDSVTNIATRAFGNSGLISVNINGSGLTSIGNFAFEGCSALTSITIPASVTSIGELAFSGCASLTSITIPSSVTSLADDVFSGCTSLETITVGADNLYYTSVDGVLFDKDQTTLLRYPAGKTGTAYTIPGSVTSIGRSAFEDCSALTSITIPESVTSLGNLAFSGCASLTSITIPSSVTSIEYFTFEDCSALTELSFACGTPPSIRPNAFANVPPNGTLHIPANAQAAYTGAVAGTGIQGWALNPAWFITATAGANGSISPAGINRYDDDTAQTFTITPNSGYFIDKVLVDGESKGAVGSYTFDTLTGNQTIDATFTPIGFTLTPAGDHDFGTATEGYTPVALTVTVTNTDTTNPTGTLKPDLSGTNAAAFELSAFGIGSIAAGGTATFTVAPITGLTAGTYAATVTVEDMSTTGTDLKRSFTVSFTVNAAPGPDPAPAPTTTGGGLGGSTYTGNEYPGSFAGGVLTVQGLCDNLTSVVVDNVILTRERDYTVNCGSTAVTFTPSYLATLKNGPHTVRVQFTDGRYMGTFTTPMASAVSAPVVDVPATGGPARAAVFVCFLGGVWCLFARMVLCKRREDSSLCSE